MHKYISMQETYYDKEGYTGNMNKENHMGHNNNPDYWNILVKDTEKPNYLDKHGLDFGCGCGRNVMNLVDRFKRMDGVDISKYLVDTSKNNLQLRGYDETRARFFKCDGTSLSGIESDYYDFVMSTIVLQHICVYNIRFGYLKEFYRILKKGGLLSFQMGFGTKHPWARDYYDNFYDATKTNGLCDVRVTDPNQIINDLKNIGYVNITYVITKSFDDKHEQWIFIKACK